VLPRPSAAHPVISMITAAAAIVVVRSAVPRVRQ
jgi:hypothetical protein